MEKPKASEPTFDDLIAELEDLYDLVRAEKLQDRLRRIIWMTRNLEKKHDENS